jgi:hypothetical protein
MEGMIGDIPWGISCRSEKFELISLDDGYVGHSYSTYMTYVNIFTAVWISVQLLWENLIDFHVLFFLFSFLFGNNT